MNAQILESKVICRQPGRYIGWPTIARTPGGELLAVFSGDRDAHVCPFGKTFLVRSPDGGAHWGAPEPVNDTPLDDRDTGLCACADGTVIVSWFTSHYLDEVYLKGCPPERQAAWRAQLAKVSRDDIRRWAGEEVLDGRYELGHWIRRSADAGRTWEPPLRVPPTTPHGPIQLSDGRLLFVGIDSLRRKDRRAAIAAAFSGDAGRTWSVEAKVHAFPPYPGQARDGLSYLCEPHVAEAAPGRLVAMARYEERPREPSARRSVLWQFDSADGGRTWTEPRPTEIVGKPPHLIRLRDGRLLVTYGFRHPPFGQRACFSHDGGQTWDYRNEVVLRDDAPNGDLGYPATVECADGTLLTVYYQVDRPGEKTCLMTTRWRA